MHRAGGKHNDLEDVGLDTYHHTFFEMLGNWSFGDYFKKEAIEWAWELVVDLWKFPAARLYATCTAPAPATRASLIRRRGTIGPRSSARPALTPPSISSTATRRTTFWMMGDTGPCGPCSELHVDLTPRGRHRRPPGQPGQPDCIEIWNLVFIQFNANPDATFSPLPAKHVDTGMDLSV